MLRHFGAVSKVNFLALLLMFEPRFESAGCRTVAQIPAIRAKKKVLHECKTFFFGRGTWNRTTVSGFGDLRTNRCTIPLRRLSVTTAYSIQQRGVGFNSTVGAVSIVTYNNA